MIPLKKLIYHGSKDIIQKPLFGYGKSYNDYGLGFYCTEIEDMAKEWAVGPEQNGYANCYELDMSNLRILNLNEDPYTILHWMEILIRNRKFNLSSALAREGKKYLTRHFHVEENTFDILIGYRADDSYFSFAQDFLNGTISVRQLNDAMHLGRLGQQIVLKSELAFHNLKFSGYSLAKHEEFYAKKQQRDQKARRDYFDKNQWVRGDIYMPQILDRELIADDLFL